MTSDRSTTRRQLLATAAGATGTLATAGCLGTASTARQDPGWSPTFEEPKDEDLIATTDDLPGRPDGVYRPPHVHEPVILGTRRSDEVAMTLLVEPAELFYSFIGNSRLKKAEPKDNVHLMAIPFDPETGTELRAAGTSVDVFDGDERVSEEIAYEMIDQRVGYHCGDSYRIPEDGTYTVRVGIKGLRTRRTGAFAGRFEESATFEFPLEYGPDLRDRFVTRQPDRAGEPGAVAPLDDDRVPDSTVPEPEDLPGTLLGAAHSDDAVLVVTRLDPDDREWIPEGSIYLAVSPRTPYRRYGLTNVGIGARIHRDGSDVAARRFEPCLDPDLDYHYGMLFPPFQSGDALELTTWLPPRLVRHLGYETAFFQMRDVTLSI